MDEVGDLQVGDDIQHIRDAPELEVWEGGKTGDEVGIADLRRGKGAKQRNLRLVERDVLHDIEGGEGGAEAMARHIDGRGR